MVTVKTYNQIKKSSGRVVFAKPGKMSWTYDAPNGNRVVSDGKLLKVDPETNEVAGMVSVGGFSSSHLAVYGDGVWTLVQANKGGFRLVRVDPRTMHVVAYKDLKPFYSIAPGGLAAGGGYVWFSSGEGLARVSP